MKKISKQNLIIIAVVAVLIVVIVVLAILNCGNVADKKQLEKDAKFKITCDGKTTILSMQDVLNLNPKDFKAVMDTSDTNPTEITLTGVEFLTLFDHCGISLDGKKSVEVHSLDGYASALTIDEVKKADNVFLCIKKNGEPLLTKSEKGMGTYLMVIRSSQFSQRWCKYVEEIVVK
ncbi:MAG: molybdopterin-dependent oxidoreductase [Clostridia bacterium]